MKKIFIIALLLLGSVFVHAQELYWETNIQKAIETSNKTNKPMLLFFTGSDWCGWCIRLQNEVFKTPDFTNWAKEKVILVELDFPRKTPQSEELRNQNNGLQQAFGIQGYPTVWFANATNKEGKVNFEQLGKTGYVAGGPSAWLEGANQILKANTKTPPPTVDEKIDKRAKKKQKAKV